MFDLLDELPIEALSRRTWLTHSVRFVGLDPASINECHPPEAIVRFPYDANLVGEIRALPHRGFDRESRCWRVALRDRECLAAFAAWLNRHPTFACSHALVDPRINNAVVLYEHHYGGANAATEASVRPQPQIAMTAHDHIVRLSFPYHSQWVKAVRSLPRCWRRFDGHLKSWSVENNERPIAELIKAGTRHGFPKSAIETLERLHTEICGYTSARADSVSGDSQPGATPKTDADRLEPHAILSNQRPSHGPTL